MYAQTVLSDNETAARARVAAGVAILDEYAPGWWTHIDRATLDVDSESDCVLAQLQRANDSMNGALFSRVATPQGVSSVPFHSVTPCEAALYQLVTHPTGQWSWSDYHDTMVAYGWWPGGGCGSELLTQVWLMEVTNRIAGLS